MKAYFDNAAATAPLPEIAQFYNAAYANPSSLHTKGIAAEQAINEVRRYFENALRVTGDIIFTSGATESNNIAVLGSVKKNARFITSLAEHPSVLEVFKHLSKQGYGVTYITPEADGIISEGSLAYALTPDVALVSLCYVNGETGAVNNIPRLAEVVKNKSPGAVFHTDAAQALGKIRISLENTDLASFSAHKLHGPLGAGALYVKNGVRLKPVMFGGGQEKGLRPGTENTPGILGFGFALKTALENIDDNYKHVNELKQYVAEALLNLNGCRVNFEAPMGYYSPYILNISIEGIKGEVLLNALCAEGFCISTGSACHSKRGGKSAVEVINAKRADNSVRISFSRFNTMPECEALVRLVTQNVNKLRKVGIK